MEVEDILVAVSAICAGRVRAASRVRREAMEIEGINDRSRAGMCVERDVETGLDCGWELISNWEQATGADND